MEAVDRQMKAEGAEGGVPGPKMVVGFSRTSGPFGLGGGLLVDQCRFDYSTSRLTGNAVLRMRSRN